MTVTRQRRRRRIVIACTRLTIHVTCNMYRMREMQHA